MNGADLLINSPPFFIKGILTVFLVTYICQMRRLAYSLVFLTLLFVGFSVAAQPYSQLQYTTDHGLPSDETFSVVQDLDGYIWVGTDKGISRFDGQTFKTYGTVEGLRSTVIYKLLASPIGGIVFYGADDHVGAIRDDSILYFDNDPSMHNGTIYESNEGPVICCRDVAKYELYSWRGQKLRGTEYPMDYYVLESKELGLISFGKKMGFIEKPGQYIGSNGNSMPLDQIHQGLSLNHSILQAKGLKLFAGGFQLSILTDNEEVRHMLLSGKATAGSYVDSSGAIWIGLFDKGVEVRSIDGETERICLLGGCSVSSICQDREGTMWLTTLKDGLFKLRKSYCEPVSLGAVSRMLEFDNQLFAIHKDSSLLCYQFQTGELTKTSTRERIKDIVVIDSVLFVSTKDVLVTPPISKNIKYLYLSNAKIGVYKGQPIGVYDRHLGIVDGDDITNYPLNSMEYGYTYVTRVYQDTIYTGRSKGLYKVFEQDGKFVSKKILSTPITCIIRNTNEGFVLGTKGHGLIFVSDNFSPMVSYTTANGLTGNYVSFLKKMGDTLICGTEKGLNFLTNLSDPAGPKMFSSFVSEGLWSGNTTDIVIKDQSLFMATDKGIQKIYRSNISKSIGNPTPVIEHINGRASRKSEYFEVSKGTTTIKVGLNVIFFHKTKNYLREYRLLGRDSLWVSTTSSELEFLNLSPGKYEVQFRTKLPESTSYSTASLKFELLPRFIQTMWFRVGVVIVLFCLTFLLFYFRDRRSMEKNNMLLFQEQLRYKTLTSQLNPHFIFNAMGSIQHLIIARKNELAAEYLASFSGLLDKTLRNTNQLFIPLADEMDFIEEYVGIERSRFEKPLALTWHLSKGLNRLSVLVPTMFLQPYIENSIIHGINPHNLEGNISVYIDIIRAKVLEIKIIDNGIGIAQSKKRKGKRERKSMAMENIKTRIQTMETLYQDKFNQSMKEIVGPDGVILGTEVVVTIPYKNR